MQSRQSRFKKLTLVLALALGGSPVADTSAQSPIQLRDVTQETGIEFQHNDGSSGQRYIVENICAGLAIFDYDGDGLSDIYFLNGGALKGAKFETPPKNRLYRNLGDWKFADVTEKAGVGDTGHSLGVAVADYDNDGDLDIYVSNYGPNVLYRNNGDGTFTDAAAEAGVQDGNKVGSGACFLDMDGDGDLDLFVSSYVQFDYANHRIKTRAGIPSYPGPLEFTPEVDTLYRNNGDGTFADVSKEAGIAAYPGTGMGVVACDFDNDGDMDIFVGNDVMQNFLFQNDGTGKFEENSLLCGVALDLGGTPQGSMGVACSDYDNDGLFDFHVTTAAKEYSTLYRNTGDGLLEDVTRPSGGGLGTLPHVAWGNSFVDFDNDGDRDLFIACGHFDDNAELRDNTTAHKVRNILLMQEDGKFVDVSAKSGDGLTPQFSSRGAAFGDLDNDGDLDGVIVNSRSKPTLLRNESAGGNHWIQVRLVGKRGTRDLEGVGARVRVVAGDLTQVDEVHSGRGYQSHYGARLHFGLGSRTHVDRIEVTWMGGAKQTIEAPQVDQLVEIKEEITENE